MKKICFKCNSGLINWNDRKWQELLLQTWKAIKDISMIDHTIWCKYRRTVCWFNTRPVVSSRTVHYWHYRTCIDELLPGCSELIVCCMFFSESYSIIWICKSRWCIQIIQEYSGRFMYMTALQHARRCMWAAEIKCCDAEQSSIFLPCRANICHLVVKFCKYTHSCFIVCLFKMILRLPHTH